MPGDGPTWIGGLVTLKGTEGAERLYASYVKIRNFLEAYERGIVVFNDDKNEFEKLNTIPLHAPITPNGHPFKHVEDGQEYIYFPTPFPFERVLATPESYRRPEIYEAFTCLRTGTRSADEAIDRAPDGSVVFGWKRNTQAVSVEDQEKLIRAGKLKPEEALYAFRDVETGKTIKPHGGSVAWNDHRKRWVMIMLQVDGSSSMLGEVWYAEADAPTGPWVYARKIVTHDRYSFYNPKHHPFFDKDGGRVIYFEGTYTATFSGNADATPRYDYNQVMYRLDLDDPRLNLPVAIDEPKLETNAKSRVASFFALERAGSATVPVYATRDERGGRLLTLTKPTSAGASEPPQFHAFAPDAPNKPAVVVPLYEFAGSNGQRVYATEGAPVAHGLKRSTKPLCFVWPNPTHVPLPRR
jgi:hypothetical protein